MSDRTTDPQALVAAAYEDAAGVVASCSSGHPEGAAGDEALHQALNAVRALIDQPAKSALDRVIAEAKAEEREACAQAAEGWIEPDMTDNSLVLFAIKSIAAAIRARGESE